MTLRSRASGSIGEVQMFPAGFEPTMWLNLPANCVFTLSMSYHFIQHWPHLSHLPAATHRQLLAARQRKYKTAIEPLRNANKATHTNLFLHFIVLSASEGQTVLLYAARSVTNQETSSRLSTSSNLFFQRPELRSFSCLFHTESQLSHLNSSV